MVVIKWQKDCFSPGNILLRINKINDLIKFGVWYHVELYLLKLQRDMVRLVNKVHYFVGPY